MNNSKYLTVTAINKYLHAQFDRNEHLQCVFLKGEISNFKGHTTGHLYFSLKDENSKINAIMFSSSASKLTFTPKDGDKVLVMGRISVYEATGNYQIYIEQMLEDGVGNLYVAYEKLKAQLEKEGLFDSKHKKAIPEYPSRIGVVTAPTGAAIKDIISTIKRRYPVAQIILFPCLVQGTQAAPDIVRSIELAEQYQIDTLIVGRGGGSIEDLWAFNEEIVARAIFNCNIPVISAVGHEIDFTIADFVADYRSPTPTGAAEVAVPDLIELNKYINQLNIRLNEVMAKKIKYQSLYLDSVKNSFVIKNPMILYENKKQKLDLINSRLNEDVIKLVENRRTKLDNLSNSFIFKNPDILYDEKKKDLITMQNKLNSLITNRKDKTRINLTNLIDKLELVNPLNILKRGYSITLINDSLVTNSLSLNKHDKITIKDFNGIISAEVIEVKENIHE